jgi:selenocysteine lyase/cysteine desulfurase
MWSQIRRDFPALDRFVYLNAAACSPTPRAVRAAVDEYSRELEEGGDRYWEDWLARREAVRQDVARFIGADDDEVAFVPNTSTGINLIADLIATDGPVLAADVEFPTVTLPWIHRGVDVRFVPATEGVIEAEAFSEPSAPGAATIVVSHVQFSNGCRQDLDAFARIKGSRRLVVCGSQSAGVFPLDVGASRIDAFATAGHKWLCAGYGAGFLWIGRELLAERQPHAIGWMSGRDPFRFDNRRCDLLPSNRRVELGCPAFGPIFALGAAIRYLGGIGIGAIARRVLDLSEYLTDRLGRAGLRVLSPAGAHRSGQTLVDLADPGGAVAFLASRQILVTEKPAGVRLSTHVYNNEDDVDRAVSALAEWARMAHQMRQR